MGYVLSKAYWGQGLMTEAAKEVLRHAFEDLGLEMVTISHFSYNQRSARVIEKLGFHREGILRKAFLRYDGSLLDDVGYSMTRKNIRICIVGRQDNMRYQYLLFDLDGTITDPKVGITTCVQYALEHFGIHEPDNDKLEPSLVRRFRTALSSFIIWMLKRQSRQLRNIGNDSRQSDCMKMKSMMGWQTC